jgi:serine/threonine protein phosphatase 1
VLWKFFRSRSRRHPPRIPAGLRLYVIGDVHGCIKLLDDLLERIDAHLGSYPVGQHLRIFLGDYVDRGPDSRAVIDRLIAHQKTHGGVYLRGNHESLMLHFLRDPEILEDWQLLGGLATLMSYGLKPPLRSDAPTRVKLAADFDAALPDSHRRFLLGLENSFTCGDFFFVHAGVRPGIALARQREEDLLWVRDEFLLYEKDFGKVVVHGHTPVAAPDVRTNRIDIDTGAYATGNLTCLVIEGSKIVFI